MSKSLPLALACATLLVSGSVQASTPKSPEAQIAKIVPGRTAGKPTNCISQRAISSSQIIRGTAIVYRMNDGSFYVNRPVSGANFLNAGNVLVTDTHSDQLCNVDLVRLVDSGTHMQSGSLGLGTFVPYPRPSKGTAG